MSESLIFISYSHQDEVEKDRLLSHLGVLQRAGLIKLWSDERILVGSNWEEEIILAMSQAKVAILLVTANFLNSEFIQNKEVPAFLEGRRDSGVTVFPIIARACPWKRVSWLAQMQVRPRNGNPVWSDGGAHVDEDLTLIAEEVADIIQAKEPFPTPALKEASQAEERGLLIVENDEKFRNLIKFALKNSGCNFYEAGSVRQAANVLRQNNGIQVIILDLELPGGIGTKLLEIIREQSVNYRVIILTANEELLAAEIAREFGVFAYLPKALKFSISLQFEVERAFQDLEKAQSEIKGELNSLDRVITTQYPMPLSYIYQELKNYLSPTDRFIRLINLFELLIHFSSIVMLADYLNGSHRITELDELVKLRIHRPSSGEWFNLCNELLKRKKDLAGLYFIEVFSDLFKGKNRKAMSDLIEIRNDHYGHSAMHTPAEYDELAKKYQDILDILMKDFRFITDFLLCEVLSVEKVKAGFRHKLRECIGTNYQPFVVERMLKDVLPSEMALLVNIVNERFIPLHPLVILASCDDCRQMEIFFYTKNNGDKLQYLSYKTGHKFQSGKFVKDFTDLIDGII